LQENSLKAGNPFQPGFLMGEKQVKKFKMLNNTIWLLGFMIGPKSEF